MRQKTISLLLILAVLFWISGCAAENSNTEAYTAGEIQNGETAGAGWSDQQRLTVLYTEPETGYTIAASDLLDTLFIAGAAYYGFESSNLLPPGQDRFQDAIEHFTPFKEHALVQQLAPYMNDYMQEVNGDAVAPVMQYVISGQIFYEENPVFAGTDEVEALIAGLYAFYVDTGAGEYLRQARLRTEMENYIPAAATEFPIAEFLVTMEDYTGNRESMYGDTPLWYYSVVTPFRPGMASFYPFQMGEGGDIYFVSQQSPYSMTDGSLDMRQTLETAVHESLHMFINEGVWARGELIESLAAGMEPGQVTCPMYDSHPWNRITDEAVVRVVQAGIYRNVYGDSQRAFDEILAKETHAGIANLDVMYALLEDYEGNPADYQTIDAFLDKLITAYYTGSPSDWNTAVDTPQGNTNDVLMLTNGDISIRFGMERDEVEARLGTDPVVSRDGSCIYADAEIAIHYIDSTIAAMKPMSTDWALPSGVALGTPIAEVLAAYDFTSIGDNGVNQLYCLVKGGQIITIDWDTFSSAEDTGSKYFMSINANVTAYDILIRDWRFMQPNFDGSLYSQAT